MSNVVLLSIPKTVMTEKNKNGTDQKLHTWVAWSQIPKLSESIMSRKSIVIMYDFGQKLGCFDSVQHFEMTGKGSRDWKTPEQISGSTVFRVVEGRTTCTFGFHMVAEKWFAPCGKCEENRGRRAWVIGELSSRGLEVLPLSAGLRLLFTFQTEELGGTRRGENGGQKCYLKPSRGCK